MKTIIAGSRNITDLAIVTEAVAQAWWDITEVVSGCADGVDTLGEQWAEDNGIPVERFPVSKAEWQERRYTAGHKRNQKMADYADALIAVWDGESGGTKDMINRAIKARLVIYVVNLKEAEPESPLDELVQFSQALGEYK